MPVIHTSDGELSQLVRSAALMERFVPGEALVLVTRADDSVAEPSLVDALASLPCIVVAVDRPAGATPPLADLTIDPAVAPLDDVLWAIEATPLAATALALLLRGADHRSPGDGLAAESAVYSLLQAGPEFAAWRARTPVRVRAAEIGPAVRVERTGDRLDLILHRPQVRNALNASMRDALLEGLAVATADSSINEVVLGGDGPTFCSGGDLDEFGSFGDPASAHLVRLAASIGRAITQLGDRIRVEVHGGCAGSGVELAAFAAGVTARPDFTAALPELSLGLVPGAGGTVSVARRIGRHLTALLALTGARIDARTALDWGLIDQIAQPT